MTKIQDIEWHDAEAMDSPENLICKNNDFKFKKTLSTLLCIIGQANGEDISKLDY